MAAAGRRKILTLDDRVYVLKRIDNGESCRSIAAAVNLLWEEPDQQNS